MHSILKIRNLKSRQLRWASMEQPRNAYRVLVGRAEGRRPLVRLKCRWEDNVKMDLREVGSDASNWMDFAEDIDQLQAYVRVVMKLQVS